jgi:thiol-disulfide isomerase/thioredoxin
MKHPANGWKMVLLVIVIVGCAFAAHWGAKALEAFTEDDVKDRLDTVSGMLVFVMEGCGYCKDLEDNVLSKLGKESDNVIVVKRGTPKGDALIEKWNVRGFPTIYFLSKGKPMRPPGSLEDGDYQGPRDLSTIRNHLKTAVDGQLYKNDMISKGTEAVGLDFKT